MGGRGIAILKEIIQMWTIKIWKNIGLFHTSLTRSKKNIDFFNYLSKNVIETLAKDLRSAV